MPLRLEHLRYFVAVAEEEQLTRAAHRLHLAQPALSKAISQLENELGVELFARQARGVALTPAGDAFLAKARVALAATDDAVWTAERLARAANGTIRIGFIGPPPLLNAPELFAVFADTHPEAEISYHGLPFPITPTDAWLEDVDVAFCHPPAVGPEVSVQAFRAEPRVVVAPSDHALAERGEVAVPDVLDETYISYHPTVQPAWAGFHSLDDHRGEPPPKLTGDQVRTPLEILAVMTSRKAVTALPACDAAIIERAIPGIVAVPLQGADEAVLSLVWRSENTSPLLEALVSLAGNIFEASGNARRELRT
jgi:DNA-binding transcriptional LysR family regulator